MIVGLSLLVASFTFLFYKISPTLWRLPWFRSAPKPALKSAPPQAPETSLQDQVEAEVKETAKDVFPTQTPSIVESAVEEKNEKIEAQKKDEIKPAPMPASAKADLDRMSMPPPSFLKAPSKPVVAPNLRAPPPPTFSSTLAQDDDYSVPSFPAINSAQRAGAGAGRVPPRFSPAPQRQPPLRSIDGPSNVSYIRAPIQSRGPPSSGLVPPPRHTSIPAKPRKKVELTPGHSPLDWATLTTNPTANLTGLPPNTPYLKVPFSELKKMTGRKGKDAWTIYQGKVYNITPYLPYHPGGEPELMKCAGRDGTKLFNEVHPWVNWEGMLGACLVGISVSDSTVKDEQSTLEDLD